MGRKNGGFSKATKSPVQKRQGREGGEGKGFFELREATREVQRRGDIATVFEKLGHRLRSTHNKR